MLDYHMSFNVKDYFELVRINERNYRICGFKLFHMSLFDLAFKNMYFRERVAEPPKCFIFR